MNAITEKINLNEVIGHFVEAEISLQGYVGKVKTNLTGRIIYSEYNASLFFKPKGSKSKGYFIENVNDIHTVKIIRKDKASNEYYNSTYDQREKFENELNERMELIRKQQEENERQRKEQFEMERKKEQEKKEIEINEAKNLGGYDELEKEVIDYYQSFKEDFFNEKFVKTTYIPIINKLLNKAINDITEYPKHYFDKKRNPKFCALIEKKLNIKLTATQKGNVDKINQYLAS